MNSLKKNILALSGLVLFTVLTMPFASATPPILPSGTIWEIEAADSGGIGNIFSIDAVTGTPGISFPIPPPVISGTANGRGLAYDPVNGNLLFTIVGSAAANFPGNGLIGQVSTTGVAGPSITLPDSTIRYWSIDLGLDCTSRFIYNLGSRL